MTLAEAELQRCVAEYSTDRWRMHPAEVVVQYGRERAKTSYRVVYFVHRPTGVQVKAHLSTGYAPTKTHRRLAMKKAKEYWLPVLEVVVKGHLKMLTARQFGMPPAGHK